MKNGNNSHLKEQYKKLIFNCYFVRISCTIVDTISKGRTDEQYY